MAKMAMPPEEATIGGGKGYAGQHSQSLEAVAAVADFVGES
jgi:hypothetical protein